MRNAKSRGRPIRGAVETLNTREIRESPQRSDSRHARHRSAKTDLGRDFCHEPKAAFPNGGSARTQQPLRMLPAWRLSEPRAPGNVCNSEGLDLLVRRGERLLASRQFWEGIERIEEGQETPVGVFSPEEESSVKKVRRRFRRDTREVRHTRRDSKSLAQAAAERVILLLRRSSSTRGASELTNRETIAVVNPRAEATIGHGAWRTEMRIAAARIAHAFARGSTTRRRKVAVSIVAAWSLRSFTASEAETPFVAMSTDRMPRHNASRKGVQRAPPRLDLSSHRSARELQLMGQKTRLRFSAGNGHTLILSEEQLICLQASEAGRLAEAFHHSADRATVGTRGGSPPVSRARYGTGSRRSARRRAGWGGASEPWYVVGTATSPHIKAECDHDCQVGWRISGGAVRAALQVGHR